MYLAMRTREWFGVHRIVLACDVRRDKLLWQLYWRMA